jgi:hypothetical protein
VTRGCRKQHNEELHNSNSSNIIRMTKSRRMRWTGHSARRGKRRNAYTIFVGKFKGIDHLEDLDTDGRITLK